MKLIAVTRALGMMHVTYFYDLRRVCTHDARYCFLLLSARCVRNGTSRRDIHTNAQKLNYFFELVIFNVNR